MDVNSSSSFTPAALAGCAVPKDGAVFWYTQDAVMVCGYAVIGA